MYETRREKERAQERRQSMREWARSQDGPVDESGPGTASNYIKHLEATDCEGKQFILYVRESGRSQKKNIRMQRKWCKKRLFKMGVKVAWVYCDCAPGYKFKARTEFAEAVNHALRDSLPIVTETTARYVRNRHYSNLNQDEVPTTNDFEKLSRHSKGVELFTILDPDASPGEIRKQETQRGQLESGVGGRPPKRDTKPGYRERRQVRLFPILYDIKEKDPNISLRALAIESAKHFNPPLTPMSISRWFKNEKLLSFFLE